MFDTGSNQSKSTSSSEVYKDDSGINRGSDFDTEAEKDYVSRRYEYGDSYYDDESDSESIVAQIEKGKKMR